jgi:hypothetical protein
MTRTVQFEIALSFAGEDREYVDRVANLLRDSGVSVFYDIFEEASLWGKNLYDHLSESYQNKALFTILFISGHYARKMWTNHERQAMQARAFQEHQEYILPARFDETPIPGVLPTVGYISLTAESPEVFVETVKRKLVDTGRTIPSASLRRAFFTFETCPRVEPVYASVTVIDSEGKPVNAADVVAIADNNTTKRAQTGQAGIAKIEIPTRRKYQLLVAHPKYPGSIVPKWDPADDLKLIIAVVESTGSVICDSTGFIPGLEGRLNPIFDTHFSKYLYADNIAIDGGRQQPAHFEIDSPFELEDANGIVMQIRVLHIQGRTSLIQYAYAPKRDAVAMTTT